MPRYRALIGNLLISGELLVPVLGGNRAIRTVIRYRNRNFQLERTTASYGIPINQLVGQPRYTHDIVVENVPHGHIRRIRSQIFELCELLGFATGSPVGFIGDSFAGMNFRPGFTKVAACWRPAMLDAADLRRYVEQVWPQYHRLRKARRLHEVFEMLSLGAPPASPLELRLLTAFWALESLKSSFAKLQGYQFVAPSWRLVPVPHNPNTDQWPKLHFAPLLDEMFAQARMRYRNRVVTLRNHIVHNGSSRMRIHVQRETESYTHSLLRKYLFRLLGYVGNYRDCDGQQISLRRDYFT